MRSPRNINFRIPRNSWNCRPCPGMLGQQIRKKWFRSSKKYVGILYGKPSPRPPLPQQTKATHDALATVRIRRPGKRRGRRCCRQGGGGCRGWTRMANRRGRFLEISYSPSWKTDITPEKCWVESWKSHFLLLGWHVWSLFAFWSIYMAEKHVFILWLTELFHGCDGICMTWTEIITWTNENTYLEKKTMVWQPILQRCPWFILIQVD